MTDKTLTSPPGDETSHNGPTDLKARIAASYDAIARTYNEWTIPHYPLRLKWLDELLGHLLANSAPKSVLELGCGCGIPVTQKLLRHPKFSVTANDISSVQLALARTNLQPQSASDRLTLLEGDMLTLNLAPESFDAIIGMYSIIHLPREEQIEMIGKVTSWLKPGGWLLANFPATDFEGTEAQHWLEQEKGWMYWSGWGIDGTVEKEREAGMDIVVQDTTEAGFDSSFLWILARKSDS